MNEIKFYNFSSILHVAGKQARQSTESLGSTVTHTRVQSQFSQLAFFSKLSEPYFRHLWNGAEEIIK
jgi:hypothetical protein